MSEVKKIATRESYGNALARTWVKNMTDVVVLDADLAGSNKDRSIQKSISGTAYRLWYCRVQYDGQSQQDLRQPEKCRLPAHLPCLRQDVLLSRCATPSDIRHLNVKIGATHAGISVGEDGAYPPV